MTVRLSAELRERLRLRSPDGNVAAEVRKACEAWLAGAVVPEDEALSNATVEAIEAADHLTDMDAGATAALLTLARKIDTEARLRELALEYAAEHGEKPPHVDNVSIPTYLKYCEALGLVPSGRVKLKPKDEEKPVGKLALLKAQASGGGRSA